MSQPFRALSARSTFAGLEQYFPQTDIGERADEEVSHLPAASVPTKRAPGELCSIFPSGDVKQTYCPLPRRAVAFHLRPGVLQAYYLPTSVAVAGLAKTAVCFGASLSLFAALVAHKVAPQPFPPPVSSVRAEAEDTGQ